MILYLGVCVIRDIAAEDRWPLFQKCKVVEHLVFIEIDLRCCDILFQTERMFVTSLFIHLPILLYQNVLEKSVEKFPEIYSQEVALYIKQRLLHFTVCMSYKSTYKSQNSIDSMTIAL